MFMHIFKYASKTADNLAENFASGEIRMVFCGEAKFEATPLPPQEGPRSL